MSKKRKFLIQHYQASGFHSLDLLTQGFQKSDLIIIAGLPSMGKTFKFKYNFKRN
jgi:replicative DNA helicase